MLEIDALCKSFGGKPALQGVSLQVGAGEIHGLLGHNGAGKSTTLGILLGMVVADSGDVRIDGVSVMNHRAQALRNVGAIFESPSFYEYLSGWENLRLLVGYSCAFDPVATRSVVEQVGLTERIHSKVRTYSHGMRQRLALAQSLLPEPTLLLLDEPTDGLDPEGIRWFRDFILRLREERGMTVLFNSHLLAEVELMCDRVTILRQGAVVFHGEVAALQDHGGVFHAELDRWELARRVLTDLGVECMEGGRLRPPHGMDPAEVVAALCRHGVLVRSFARARRSLEDVYLEQLER